MPLTVHLLGEPHVEVQGQRTELPPHRPVFLLVYLACAGDWVRREELLGVFWPDELEANARRSLRVLLNRAKAFAWAQGLESEPLRLRWRVPCDVQALRAAFGRGDWETVVRLHRQPLLAGFPLANVPGFEAWCEAERDALLTMWRKATLQHAADLGAVGDHARAAALLGTLLAYEPLAEDVLGRFLEQAYLGGDRDGALRGYARFREQLNRELGLEPLAHTQELFRTVQRAERLAVAATPVTPERVRVPLAVYRPPRVVGRTPEAALVRCAATPVVLVAGEPGVGKTRLLEELVPDAVWCRCREGLANLPYAPLVELIRGDLGRVPELGSYREDLARLVPEVAPGLVPGPLEPLLAKARLTEALARLCESLGAPVVFDDLQWADPGTLELFIYLANRGTTGRDAGLYGAYRRFERSSALDAALAGLRAQGLLTEVPLEPLLAEEVRELVGELIGVSEGPVVFSRWLFGRSRGNPLFALETLKSLFETGVLQARGGGWHTHLDDVTRDYSELDVPPKIAELVARRAASLSEGAQRVLRAASVAREGFTAKLLAKVTGLSETAAVDALAEAEQNGLISGAQFTHDVLRQTLYTRLPPTRRTHLHAGIAAGLKGRADPLVVAEHFVAANEPAKALVYQRKAADAYLGRGLYAQAKRVLEQASALVEGEGAWETEVKLAEVYVVLADPQAESLLARLLERPLLPPLKADAFRALAKLRLHQGKIADAAGVVSAWARLVADFDPDERYPVEVMRAEIAILQGDNEQAGRILEPLVERSRREPPSMRRVEVLVHLGDLYINTGRNAEATRLFEEAWGLAERFGVHHERIDIATYLLFAAMDAGHPERALPLAESALALGDYAISLTLRNNLAKAYIMVGRDADARRHCEFIIAEGSNPTLVSISWSRLADIFHRADVPERVHEALERALATLPASDWNVAHFTVAVGVAIYGTDEQLKTALASLGGMKAPYPELQARLEQVLAARGLSL